jgi:glycosyltransferase involved in cell wall biosynthesis
MIVPGHRGLPLVTIVIPTYNRGRLLPACIDSALAQDYPSFEVVVVDDGSTDRTAEVCEGYGSRIRYFRKPNGGAASALNYGIGKMRGTWFKWLSSDDELEPGALSALVEGGKSGAGVVYGDFAKIDSHGRVIGRYRERDFRSLDDFVLGLWWHFAGSAAAAIVLRACFDRVRLFDETLRYAEDYDWWLRAAMVHGIRFMHIPTSVARYRIHPGQITREKLEATEGLRRQMKRNLINLLRERASKDERLAEYYSLATGRYRRIFRPVTGISRFLSTAPRASTAQYWLERLLPRWSSMVYWALNPPYPAKV